MQNISGRLISKSVVYTGQSARGSWRIIKFIIEKNICRKKRKIIFTSSGATADFVDLIPIKEKIKISYFPECKDLGNNRWVTDLKAISVEKYISKKTTAIYNDSGDIMNPHEIDFTPENKLDFNPKK